MPDPWLVVAGIIAGEGAGVVAAREHRAQALAWVVGATIVALWWCNELGVWIGMAAGMLAARVVVPPPWRWPVLAVGGCVLGALAPAATQPWMLGLPLLLLTSELLVRRLGPAPVWWLTSMGTLGAYTAVPDTEAITILAVAAAAACPWALRAEDDDAGPVALVAVFFWACASGARGRPVSLVVAPALWAPILAVALACPRGAFPWDTWRGALVVGAQLVLALLICRTAGIEADPARALQWAGVGTLVGTAAMGTLAWSLRSRP